MGLKSNADEGHVHSPKGRHHAIKRNKTQQKKQKKQTRKNNRNFNKTQIL